MTIRAWTALGTGLFAWVVLAACGSNAAKPEDRLCTPGAYVFCRCADRSEGTKLCNEDGKGFQACEPCDEHGGEEEDGDEFEDDDRPFRSDAGFEPVDAKPSDGLKLDEACANKLVFIAGHKDGIEAYAGVYRGNGQFELGSSRGPGLRSIPTILSTESGFVAAYLSRMSLLATTSFDQTWAPPVGVVNTTDPPALVELGGNQAMVVYIGLDGRYHEGRSPAWLDSDVLAENTEATVTSGRSAPAVVATRSGLMMAFTSNDRSLYLQQKGESGWSKATAVTGVSANAMPPAAVGLEGPVDMLVVYAGADLVLRSVARDVVGGFRPPEIVHEAAFAAETPRLVALADGRALLMFMGVNSKPYTMTFDPRAERHWSAPVELMPGKNPAVASTPSVVASRCGSAELTAAYAEADGAVSFARFESGTWKGPYSVSGIKNMTYVGVGERR